MKFKAILITEDNYGLLNDRYTFGEVNEPGSFLGFYLIVRPGSEVVRPEGIISSKTLKESYTIGTNLRNGFFEVIVKN